MTFSLLPPARVAALRAADFSYDAVGATAGEVPGGYGYIRRTRLLESRDLDAVADILMSWRMHQGAGLRVAASSASAAEESVAEMRLGIGFASLRIPCRVVYVVDETNLRGFAYGTLPGHPESGEERFVVQRLSDGRIEATISAFSKPVTRSARLGGPITGWIQRVMTERYLAALDDAR